MLNLVVRKLSNDPIPHGYSLPNGHSPPRGFSTEPENPTPSDPSLPNRELDVEDVVLVLDAQSASNEVGVCLDVHVECRFDESCCHSGDPFDPESSK
jgi:hypothetical protein